MLRRTKAQLLSHEIPPITHKTLMIPMLPKVVPVYQQYYNEFIELCGVDREEGTQDPSYYFTMLRRLRMGCNHPLQFDIRKSYHDRPYIPTEMERAVNRRMVPPDPKKPDDPYVNMPVSTKEDWELSTKLKTLIWSIMKRRPAPGAIRKVVVYSQWTSTMTWQAPLPLLLSFHSTLTSTILTLFAINSQDPTCFGCQPDQVRYSKRHTDPCRAGPPNPALHRPQ